MLSFVVLVLVHVLYIFTVFHFIPFIDSSSPLGIFPFFLLSFAHFLFFPTENLRRPSQVVVFEFSCSSFLPFVPGTLATSMLTLRLIHCLWQGAWLDGD